MRSRARRVFLILSAGVGLTVMGSTAGAGEEDSAALIDVRATRLRPERTAGGPSTPLAPLAVDPGIVLNSPGSLSGQNDISIQGSSFSGAGLAVEGVALRHSQTEHFNAELPFPPGLFDAPRVYSGLDQMLATSGHLVGTADFGFAPVARRAEVTVGGGDAGWNWQEAAWNHVWEGGGNPPWGGGLFAWREDAPDVDSAGNDIERQGGGVHLQGSDADDVLDAAFGAQQKSFGTQGYYGVNPDWASDEKTDDRLLMLSLCRGDREGSYSRWVMAGRLFEDEYQLFIPEQPVYRNEHESRMGTGSADGRLTLMDPSVVLNWRAGLEVEDIESRTLGNHQRERGDLLLVPAWSTDRWLVSAGANGAMFSETSGEMLPQAGVEWRATEAHALFLSYSETVRQPSYTELNYESPGSLGQAGLDNEKASQIETGWRGEIDGTEWRMAGFLRESRHTVDWVKATPDAPRWVATDLGDVEVVGMESSFRRLILSRVFFDGSYTWLDKNADADVYAGRYVLDYAEHTARFRAEWHWSESVRVAYVDTLRWMHPTEARAGTDRFGTSGRVALHVRPAPGVWDFGVACDDVWNDDVEWLMGQPTPEPRVSAMISRMWP